MNGEYRLRKAEPNVTDRTQRLEMKLTGDEKRLLDRAAELVGAESLGGWVRTLALREARKVLRESGERT